MYIIRYLLLITVFFIASELTKDLYNCCCKGAIFTQITISNLIGKYFVNKELVRRIKHLFTISVNSVKRSKHFARSESVAHASCPFRIGVSKCLRKSYNQNKRK